MGQLINGTCPSIDATPSELLAWSIMYYILGVMFIVFAIVYVYQTISVTIAEKDEGQGQFNAQISYIVALFVKGSGLCISGLFLSVKNPCYDNTFYNMYSVLPGGIPGYVTSIAYCFIFFSWCSVCFDSFEKQTTKFYDRSRWIMILLSSLVIVLFFIMFICMIVVDTQKFHRVEQGVAISRDLILAIAFIVYMYKIYKLFEEPCPGCHAPEQRLFLLCLTLIVSLICRPICIGLYSIIIHPPGGTSIMSEFSASYLVIYLVEFLITELIPLTVIGITRLCGTAAERNVNDDIASFMAIV